MDVRLYGDDVDFIFSRLINYKETDFVVRSAKRAAGNVIRKAAAKSTRFKDKTGTLRKSLKTARSGLRIGRDGYVGVVTGWKGKNKGVFAPHGHLVEFGHNSKRNGPVKGRHFLRHAAQENIKEAYIAFSDQFDRAMSRKLDQISQKAKNKLK